MVRVYMSWLQNSRFLGSRSNCFAGRREIGLYRIGSLCALTRVSWTRRRLCRGFWWDYK